MVIRDITERKRSEAIQSALYRISEKVTTAPDLGDFTQPSTTSSAN